MEWLSNPDIWGAFLTLTALEIVLGIDNIIFISILTSRLPEHQRRKGQLLGLGLAMGMRILLLLALTWIMGLTRDMFEVLGHGISGRDLILLGGGLFLIAKATREIHNALEGESHHSGGNHTTSFMGVLAQIAIVDVVFSLDSVITAVGLVQQVPVMIAAIVISVGVMMLAAASISAFVEAHPTIKMLALSFLIMVGLMLVGESFDMHVPKGYVYFAMAFSFGVEMLNIRAKKRKTDPLKLRQAQLGDLIS